jgi:hypothetical protein
MAFNPDEFLTQTQKPAQSKSSFDPDSFLESTKPKMGMIESGYSALEKGVGSVAEPVLSTIAKPFQMLSSATEPYVQKPIREKLAERSGVNLMPGETLKDVVAQKGLPNKPLSEYAPSLFSETGEGFKLKKGGLLDVSPAGVVGGAAEMAIDPSSYLPMAGGLISKGAQKAGLIAKGAESFSATKALGATQKTFEDLAKIDKKFKLGKGVTAKQLGTFAKDEGIVKAGSSIDDISLRADKLSSETGKKLGQKYKELESKIYEKLSPSQLDELAKTDLDPESIALRAIDNVKAKKSFPGQPEQLKIVENEAYNFARLPKGSDISDINDYRIKLDRIIYDTDRGVKLNPELKPKSEALKLVRDAIEESIDDRIKALDKITGGQDLKELNDLNKKFSLASKAQAIASKHLSRTEGNRAVSMTDYMSGIGGAAATAATGNITPVLTGLAAVGGNKLAREYGRGLMSGAAGTAAKGFGLITPRASKLGLLVGSIKKEMDKK